VRRAAALAVGLMALCASAHADAPPAQDVVARPDGKSGEAGLWMACDAIEKELAVSPLVVRDPALNAYVSGIVCKLAGPNCAGLRVYVVSDASFNAAAWPNGMVVVNTGLLLRTENEAQLVFVLGHEITHFLKRHTWNNFDSVRRTSDVLAFLSIGVAAAGVSTGTNLSGVSNLATLIAAGALLSYNRDQEREADAGGFTLAVAGGYDPRQGQILWTNVDDEVEAEPERRRDWAFFSNHPTDKERLATMAKLADQAEAGAHAGDLGTERLKAVVAPHRAEWLAEELNRGHFSQSIQMIGRLIKNDAQAGELRYFLGEAYRRRNADGDLAQAVQSYQASIAGGGPVLAYRGLGIAALKSGDMGSARDAFKKYLDLAPSADDRAMVTTYLARAEGQ
jgi:Zn-dependent protease with chaperone function